MLGVLHYFYSTFDFYKFICPRPSQFLGASYAPAYIIYICVYVDPVIVTDMQTPLPSKRVVFNVWFKMTRKRNVLKRIKNQLFRFLVFEIWLILHHIDIP